MVCLVVLVICSEPGGVLSERQPLVVCLVVQTGYLRAWPPRWCRPNRQPLVVFSPSDSKPLVVQTAISERLRAVVVQSADRSSPSPGGPGGADLVSLRALAALVSTPNRQPLVAQVVQTEPAAAGGPGDMLRAVVVQSADRSTPSRWWPSWWCRV